MSGKSDFQALRLPTTARLQASARLENYRFPTIVRERANNLLPVFSLSPFYGAGGLMIRRALLQPLDLLSKFLNEIVRQSWTKFHRSRQEFSNPGG